MKKYFGNWEKHDDLVSDFSEYSWRTDYKDIPPEGIATDEEVLFATYDCPSYEGYAQVLFTRDGKLFEVEGSHCSCDGLGGQWKPGEVTWDALALRGDSSWCSEVKPEAKEAFRALVMAATSKGGET